MRIDVSSSTAQDSTEAAIEILNNVKGEAPALIILYGTANHEYDKVVDQFMKAYPKTKIAGSTSCTGIITSDGFISENATGMGAMLFGFDNNDSFGVGMSQKSDAQECAYEACTKSLIAANREGELPCFIWIMCSPGKEEDYIIGIEKHVGRSVPIYGGSCADNDLSGKWKLFNEHDEINTGVVLISFFASDFPEPVSSFHCGYMASEKKGVVTKASERNILEIDGLPALSVYNTWTNGALADRKAGDSILEDTTLLPLGRNSGEVRDIPFYLLSHPATVTEQDGLSLFTDVKVGEVVCMMQGSIESLVKRAGEVVNSVLKREQITLEELSGALIVYCAGCMFAVNGENKMHEVAEDLKDKLGKIPFMGVFTFGEQGGMLGKTNLHGNLMISVTLFRK